MRRMSGAVRVISGIALASALCVPASAAADYFLKIKGLDGGGTKASSDKPRIAVIEFKNKADGAWSPEFAIDGFSWGESGAAGGFGEWIADVERPAADKVSKVDAITIKQSATAAAGGEKGGTEDINIGVGELSEAARANDRLRSAGPKDGWPAATAGEAEITLKGDSAPTAKPVGNTKWKNIVLKRGTDAAAGGVAVAAGDVDGDGAASGLPTGKRQHKPVLSNAAGGAEGPLILLMPLATGSVTLAGRFSGCAVGDRFAELELGGGGGPTYTLTGAVVTRCSEERISLNYEKIKS